MEPTPAGFEAELVKHLTAMYGYSAADAAAIVARHETLVSHGVITSAACTSIMPAVRATAQAIAIQEEKLRKLPLH